MSFQLSNINQFNRRIFHLPAAGALLAANQRPAPGQRPRGGALRHVRSSFVGKHRRSAGRCRRGDARRVVAFAEPGALPEDRGALLCVG